jgi:nitrile hydratase subunit alpha
MAAHSAHDIGGQLGFGPVAGIDEHRSFTAGWEARVFGLMRTLIHNGFWTTDEWRYAVERVQPARSLEESYFGRWLLALEGLCEERGLLSAEDVAAARRATDADAPDDHVLQEPATAPVLQPGREDAPRWKAGDAVQAMPGERAGHTRLPAYARGATGVVHATRGRFEMPDAIVHDRAHAVPVWLHNVAFRARDLFGDGHPRDWVHLDLYEPYLQEPDPASSPHRDGERDLGDADHVHHDSPIARRTGPPTRRVAALEAALVAGGHLRHVQVDDVIELYSDTLGPRHGAALIAAAWKHDDVRRRLFDDAGALVAERGYDGRGATHAELPWLHLVAVANDAATHNLVVCTLCSCYPLSLLGPQPRWYKSLAYRARAVREPRAVLAEFGVSVDAEVELHVWDSTADCRYIVVPQAPPGAQALDEGVLASLVTRDSMIGTGLVGAPR